MIEKVIKQYEEYLQYYKYEEIESQKEIWELVLTALKEKQERDSKSLRMV